MSSTTKDGGLGFGKAFLIGMILLWILTPLKLFGIISWSWGSILFICALPTLGILVAILAFFLLLLFLAWIS